MKLDSTVSKVYYSRDGRIAARVDNFDQLQWCISTGRGFAWHSEGDEINGDWLPANPPKFPELPPKPGLVLFTQSHWAPENTYWGTIKDGVLYVVDPDSGYSATYNLLYAKIVVIPHPDNDPEMVKVIEESKR